MRALHQLKSFSGTLPGVTPAAQLRVHQYATVPDNIRAAFGYCVQQVRQYDYLNYIWVAQMSKDLRPALFALRAFNIETALVADTVRSKEAVVGQIRFQWWRDAVKAAYEDRPPNHPVALALAHVLHSPPPSLARGGGAGTDGAAGARADGAGGAGSAAAERQQPGGSSFPDPGAGVHHGCMSAGSGAGSGVPAWDAIAGVPGGGAEVGAARAVGGPGRLSRYSFKRIIDCREADFLDPQPPLDLGALEQYAEGTASQLMYLQLAAAGIKDREADHAASHLGRAAGIITLLRGTAAHAAARRSYLPVDICAEARVSQEDVYGGVVSEGLRDVVHKVASLAKGHLDEARRLAPRLPPSAAGLMLPAVAVGRYLEALEAANFNPYDSGLLREQGVGVGDRGGGGGAPLAYVLAVKWHHWRGTF